MMRKEVVVAIFAVLMITLLTSDVTQAVNPNLSVQPVLIQDQTMKPLDSPLQSHPTANQYTAPVTNPANAYDNNQVTYSSTNITQQPYPSVYSKPTADSHNATMSDDTKAYDLSNSTFAAIAINNQAVEWPSMKQYSVQTFSTTGVTTISSIDIHIKYNLTLTVVGKIGYKFRLYVSTKSRVLQDLTWTQLDVGTTTGSFIAVPEPNDGIWSTADITNIRVSIETGRNQSSDRGTFRVFEVWTRIYSPVVKYFDVRTFSPTAISGYSYLAVNINCSIFIGGCSYKILVSVGSANTTLQNWNDVSQIDPKVFAWEQVTEPNDGWWNQADLSNLRIIIETQKIKSQNNGEFRVYEAWVLISPPTTNSYPGNHGGTATVSNPTLAYDKNQITFASITPPSTTATYFAVKSFNTTTLKEYATINIQMRYNVTTWGGGQYRIYIQVGTKWVNLQKPTDSNQTEPIVRTWVGVCEPNDAIWSSADLGSMEIRVQVVQTVTGGTCTFREYDTWATIPEDHFTVRAYVSDIQSSAPLYAWEFNLTFNPAVLRVAAVSEGPFLRLAGTTKFTNYTIADDNPGLMHTGCAVDDWYGGGVYGSGAIATVTFQAIAKGNSMFNFTGVYLLSFDEVLEVPVDIVGFTTSPGWFQYLAGDVNGDAKVDAYDLNQLGKAYGKTSGNPSYDWDADQDKDGDVDVDDLTTVKVHYGDT